jgi:hypothetical protein
MLLILPITFDATACERVEPAITAARLQHVSPLPQRMHSQQLLSSQWIHALAVRAAAAWLQQELGLSSSLASAAAWPQVVCHPAAAARCNSTSTPSACSPTSTSSQA